MRYLERFLFLMNLLFFFGLQYSSIRHFSHLHSITLVTTAFITIVTLTNCILLISRTKQPGLMWLVITGNIGCMLLVTMARMKQFFTAPLSDHLAYIGVILTFVLTIVLIWKKNK